jgi:DnaD/phage-associated family protein
MRKKHFDALDNILDRPIAFNPSFKKITGSTNAALLLSQAFYWTKRTNDKEGWFYKTREEWVEETGLTLEELDGARAKCKASGVMEEKLKGVPATVHYRVNKPKVYELLGFQFGEFPQSGLSDLPQIGGKPESGSDPNFNKVTESTSGITNDNDSAAIEERTSLFATLYSNNIGAITPLMADLIRNMAIDYPDSTWYQPAFEIAVKNNARNLNYVDAVLKGWKDHYFGWKPERQNNRARGKQQPAPVQESPEELAARRAEADQLFGNNILDT